MSKSNKIEFKSLNALRFFSFFAVFLSHIGTNIFVENFDYFRKFGHFGVRFFFTISGFLITYIVLNEKILNGNFSIKNFFIRRILRIWPLYYLFVVFAILSNYVLTYFNLATNDNGYYPNWIFTFLFLENYQTMYYGYFANVSPLPVLWSVCIEEHFYLIWGFILFFLPIKKMPIVFFILFFIGIIAQFIYKNNEILFLDLFTNIHYFLSGILLAYFTLQKKINQLFLPKYYKIRWLFFLISLLVVVLFSLVEIKILILYESIFMSLAFAWIIAFLVFEEKINVFNQSNIFTKLGNYTYGLYLVHSIVIMFFLKLNIFPANYFGLFLHLCFSLIFSIVIAKILYHTIEKPILKLKSLFTYSKN